MKHCVGSYGDPGIPGEWEARCKVQMTLLEEMDFLKRHVEKLRVMTGRYAAQVRRIIALFISHYQYSFPLENSTRSGRDIPGVLLACRWRVKSERSRRCERACASWTLTGG